MDDDRDNQFGNPDLLNNKNYRKLEMYIDIYIVFSLN